MNIFACGNTVFFFIFLFNLQKHFELETYPSAKASNTTLASDVRELTEVCSPIFSLPVLSWRPPWNISKPRLQNSIEFILSKLFQDLSRNQPEKSNVCKHQCSDSHRATFHIDIMVECMIPCLIEIESGQWQTTGFAFDWPTFLHKNCSPDVHFISWDLRLQKTPEGGR